MKPRKVTRESLYDEVWSTPMLKLAVGYGVTSVALANTCRRLNVPVPPRGHWQKVQRGKRTNPRPPLPPLAEGGRAAALITPSPQSSPRPPPAPVVVALAETLREEPNRIRVGDRLTRPHLAVVAPPVPADNRRSPPIIRESAGLATLPISVSKGSHSRALRIMDALVKALEVRGYPASAKGASIEGQTVLFGISETNDRKPHVVTATENAQKARHPWTRLPVWDHVPSGRLVIAYEGNRWWRPDLIRKWSDGRSGRLEDRLDVVLLGLVAIGAALRVSADEARVRAAEAAEWERQRQERLRQERINAARDKAIVDAASAFAEAEKIRRLAEVVERRSRGNGTSISNDTQQWLVRAITIADRLDPLSGGVGGMLTTHEEAAQRAGDTNPARG